METTFYELLGREPGIRALVDRFYDLMDTLPEAREVRALHFETLEGSREKLYLFLVGWSGGPQVYVERFGHPRLRARHLPFTIGDAARDQWMLCMTRALEDTVPDVEVRGMMQRTLARIADHMRNA